MKIVKNLLVFSIIGLFTVACGASADADSQEGLEEASDPKGPTASGTPTDPESNGEGNASEPTGEGEYSCDPMPE